MQKEKVATADAFLKWCIYGAEIVSIESYINYDDLNPTQLHEVDQFFKDIKRSWKKIMDKVNENYNHQDTHFDMTIAFQRQINYFHECREGLLAFLTDSCDNKKIRDVRKALNDVVL